MTEIVPGLAFVTTDADVAGLIPGHDPAQAVRDAERHHAATLRRLSRDRITDLRERGKISRAEARAGAEIGMVVEFGSGAHGATAQSQLRPPAAAGTAGDARWIELAEAEATRFAPWLRYARAYAITRSHTLRDLTLAVAVDGLGVQQVADRMRMDRRRALALLRRSLAMYAWIAHWIAAPEPEDIA